ncbi:MAG: YHS domain-containing protein [Euryarchaeota archaeon]|nr:YHS domain-containing protein [Euryarchaeota archaeon]
MNGVPVARDPVCGMLLPASESTLASHIEAKTYYFCSESCRTRFGARPAAYLEATA